MFQVCISCWAKLLILYACVVDLLRPRELLILCTAGRNACLSPWRLQAFSVNALSQTCESALTNLDNAQRALSNLLIARSRIMHRNNYETNYAPNVPYISVQIMWAAKNPLRAPNYFCNPLPWLSACSCSTFRSAPSFFCNSRLPHRSETPDFWLAALRATFRQ